MAVMAGEAMLVAAFPRIEAEFGISSIATAWILPAMMLVGVVMMPALGSLGDIHGKKTMLIICLAVYATGVIFGGFAGDIVSLLLCRFLQGIGLGIAPIACALIAEQLPRPRVPGALGLLSATDGAGTVVGVLAGSCIVEWAGWRTCYHIAAPVALLILIAAWVLVRPSPVRSTRRIDVPGIALLSIALFSGLLALSFLNITLGVISVCTLTGFLFWERKTKSPLFDLRFVRRHPMPTVCINAGMVMLLYFLLLQVMPYVIESPAGLGLSAIAVGLIMVPGTVADMISGVAAGRFAGMKGIRIPYLIGALELAIACMLLLILPLSAPLLVIVWIAVSSGMSILITVDSIAVVASARPDRMATASSLVHTFQNLGGAVGPLVAGLALAGSKQSYSGFSTAFLIGMIISGFVLVQAVRLRQRKKAAGPATIMSTGVAGEDTKKSSGEA
nr:MFS transporter [uncultured Methanofollis sp.]